MWHAVGAWWAHSDVSGTAELNATRTLVSARVIRVSNATSITSGRVLNAFKARLVTAFLAFFDGTLATRFTEWAFKHRANAEFEVALESSFARSVVVASATWGSGLATRSKADKAKRITSERRVAARVIDFASATGRASFAVSIQDALVFSARGAS